MPMPMTVRAVRGRIRRRLWPAERHRYPWTKTYLFPATKRASPLTGAYGRGATYPLAPSSRLPLRLARQWQQLDRTPPTPLPRYLTRTPLKIRRQQRT